MLKMSGTPQLNHFSQLFKNCLKCGIFPVDLKKGNTESTNKTSKTFVQSLFFQSAAKLLNYHVNPSRSDPGRRETNNLNTYFHTFLWCLKRSLRPS